MNEKMPQWLNILSACIVTVLFLSAAIKSSIPVKISSEEAISNCIPGIISLVAFVLIKVLWHDPTTVIKVLWHDPARFLVLACLIGSGVVFYVSTKEQDKETKATIVGFASALLGFATGLPIGKQLSKDKTHENNKES